MEKQKYKIYNIGGTYRLVPNLYRKERIQKNSFN